MCIRDRWNDSYLFSSREEALEELEILKKKPEEINKTFRPQFENLSGPVLLDFLNAEKEFAKSLEVLYVCLLYTSDAADERSSVDLGGRRIIKKQNNKKKKKKTKNILSTMLKIITQYNNDRHIHYIHTDQQHKDRRSRISNRIKEMT